MAKTHTKTLQSNCSKPTLSRFLCCFGSFSRKTYIENFLESESDLPKEKSRRRRGWISWRRIPMKNAATKTVPIEASVSDEIIQTRRRANKLHSSKSKSRSNLNHSFLNTRIPPPNPASPAHTPPPPPVVSVEPSQTLPQVGNGHRPRRNVSGELEHREHSNLVESDDDDTRQQTSSSPSRTLPAMSSHSFSTSKRQPGNSPSFVRPQTTSKRHERADTTMRSFHPLVGMSVVVVTLMIMILCGRLCAILCTSVWLYAVPRFRTKVENDRNKIYPNSSDLDLDSEDYKRRVVLEGLLERKKHRATTS